MLVCWIYHMINHHRIIELLIPLYPYRSSSQRISWPGRNELRSISLEKGNLTWRRSSTDALSEHGKAWGKPWGKPGDQPWPSATLCRCLPISILINIPIAIYIDIPWPAAPNTVTRVELLSWDHCPKKKLSNHQLPMIVA